MLAARHGVSPNGSVASALVGVLRLPRYHDSIFAVRSIDSANSRGGLCNALEFHRVPYEIIGDNVCVSAGALQRGLDDSLLTGFDEVWVFPDGPPALDLSSLPGATSDATDFSAGIQPILSEAMSKTNCAAILGDGCGLNYATTDADIAEAITARG